MPLLKALQVVLLSLSRGLGDHLSQRVAIDLEQVVPLVVVAMLMEEEECDDPPLLPSDKAEADIASLQGKVQI